MRELCSVQRAQSKICMIGFRTYVNYFAPAKLPILDSAWMAADPIFSTLHIAKLPNIDSNICALCRLSTSEYSDGYFALPPKLKIVISPLKVKQIILAIFVGEKELILAYLIFRKIIWFSVKIKSYSVFSLFPSFLLYKIRTYLSKVVQLMSLYSPLLWKLTFNVHFIHRGQFKFFKNYNLAKLPNLVAAK